MQPWTDKAAVKDVEVGHYVYSVQLKEDGPKPSKTRSFSLTFSCIAVSGFDLDVDALQRLRIDGDHVDKRLPVIGLAWMYPRWAS